MIDNLELDTLTDEQLIILLLDKLTILLQLNVDVLELQYHLKKRFNRSFDNK